MRNMVTRDLAAAPADNRQALPFVLPHASSLPQPTHRIPPPTHSPPATGPRKTAIRVRIIYVAFNENGIEI